MNHMNRKQIRLALVKGDYDSIRERLAVCAVPVEGNEELLSSAPHKVKEDMALVYRILTGDAEHIDSMIQVTNDMMERFGITPEQLHKDALASSAASRPVKFERLTKILSELSGEPEEVFAGGKPVDWAYVATTSGSPFFGAGVLFYPGFLQTASSVMGGGFYILPSSVHEVLLVKDDVRMSPGALRDMVRDINAEEVSDEDKLTDSIYYYSCEKDDFSLVEAA